METVTSRDGTPIAFARSGAGPVVITITGAMGVHQDPRLVALLARHFTVFDYARRGRGESGDTQPYAVEREIEDVAALIAAAGGAAYLYGMSSGASLALGVANHLPAQVGKLALYDPPLIVSDSRPPVPDEYVPHLNELVAAGRRGDAVEYFMRTAIRLPEAFIGSLRAGSEWPRLEALAHTLAYDGAVVGGTMSGRPLPTDRWTAVTMPTLVLNGGASEQFFRDGAQALAALLPNAQHRVLPGQEHNVAADALGPALNDFFLG